MSELFGVFGQTVTAVSEGGVVVVIADARVQADAVDDMTGIQPVCGGVAVQFVEIGNTHGQVSVAEQLDRFRFG